MLEVSISFKHHVSTTYTSCKVIRYVFTLTYRRLDLTGVERSLLEQLVVCSLHECS